MRDDGGITAEDECGCNEPTTDCVQVREGHDISTDDRAIGREDTGRCRGMDTGCARGVAAEAGGSVRGHRSVGIASQRAVKLTGHSGIL